jgi:hypothetical protein
MANKINPTDHMRDTLDIIFDILGGVGVESFVVTFDGSGDDGQVESPSDFNPAKSEKKAAKIFGEVVEGARVSDAPRYLRNGHEHIWKSDPTLEDMVQTLCYEALESVSSGWEINEGSHGIFLFDVKKRKMRLDFNERVIEDRNYEFVM